METKFENIKVGDTVMIRAEVSTGWNRAAFFWIPQAVTKTTATRFTVGHKVYLKKDGSRYGGGSFCDRAKILGEKTGHRADEVVVDQSKEMEEMKADYAAFVSIRNFNLGRLEYDNKNIRKIKKLFDQIAKLAKDGEV